VNDDSPKTTCSYFKDHFFGYGKMHYDGVEREKDELGDVHQVDKSGVVVAKKFNHRTSK
jgi:hypothetical protein